jgi:putative phosphoesterase
MSALLRARRSALRVGVLSDIHARFGALERALDVLERAGVDRLVCLGDVVEKGPDPDRVVERLDRLLVPTVRGNHDDNAVAHAALDPAAAGMSRDTLGWLAALPLCREYAWAGRYVALAHASLRDNGSGVRPGHVPKAMRRALRSCDADVVLLGHTHIPMRMRIGERWLCNPGSTSLGRGASGSSCAVLSLPELSFEVYALPSGERLDLGDR